MKPTQSDDDFQFYAFISYSSQDLKWGKRLQRKLEHYRMPATMCSEHGWTRTPINPVFFAPSDIQPGDLDEEIKERLVSSRNLIVICSPNSAKSDWVGKEIKFFHQLGRTKQIHFFIIDGLPHSKDPDTECLHPIIETLGIPEILGANINEKIYRWPYLNKERAYIQLISKILNVEFDSIWQRHKRIKIQKTILGVIGLMSIISALVLTWLVSRPLDVNLKISDNSFPNQCLPQFKDGIISLYMPNEVKIDTLQHLDSGVIFRNVPARFFHKKIRCRVVAKDYMTLDTLILLEEQMQISIRRDPKIYGHVYFQLWSLQNERPLRNVKLNIENHTLTSDSNGCVEMNIPLDRQKTFYHVTSDTLKIDDTLYMPCGINDAILAK